MATVGEIRAQLSHAIMRGGEGWQSLQSAKELIGAAIEAFHDSFEVTSVAAEGAEGGDINFAMRKYIEAESDARAVMQKVEDAQDAALGGNESAELYMSML